LELGIGTGEFTKIMGLQSPQVVGVDISMGMLELASQVMPGLRLIRADAHSLPLADASFDMIISRKLLRLCSDVRSVLQEAYRVCRPNGELLIVETCAVNEEDENFWNEIIRIAEPYQFPIRSHSELVDLCKKAGFREIRWSVFEELRVSTKEYFRIHYCLDDQQIDKVWELYESTSPHLRELKKLEKLEDGSYSLEFHWVMIVGKKQDD
jgi:ubiquinone/menaquinone biosynthesis C-methylase UbiE